MVAPAPAQTNQAQFGNAVIPTVPGGTPVVTPSNGPITATSASGLDVFGNPVQNAGGTNVVVGTSSTAAPNRSVDAGGDAAESYLDTFTPPESADQIAEDLRQQSQGQIDGINQQYDDQVAAEEKAGQERVGQTDATSVLSGLMGSTEAGAARGATQAANQKNVDAINDQRANALATVYSKISSDAATEAEQQKTDATKSAEDIVARRTQVQTDAVNDLKQMASSGLVDFDAFKNNPQNAQVYQHALASVGGSDDALQAIFALNRPQDTLVGSPTRIGNNYVQAYKNPVTGQVSMENVPLPVDLPENYTNFQKAPDGSLLAFPDNWDGDVSKIVTVANTSGTGGTGTGSGLSDPQLIAQAIENGNQPPSLTGLYGKGASVRAALETDGYNLTQATEDWTATQKLLSTMNGQQQTKLRESVNQVSESLGLVQQLSDKWNGGSFPVLNKVNLTAAKNGAYGADAQSLATQLDAEIADVTSELGTVYKGGNTSTDSSLALAAQQLSSSWSKDTLDSAIQLARTNIQYRQNSLSLSTAGVSDSQYNPMSTATSTPQTDTSSVQDRAQSAGYDYNAMVAAGYSDQQIDDALTQAGY
ncbi:MAG TPA: hypothetical protein VGG11_13785 [Xanthobacteraceae bacterium]|jgi:hypothetical protein